VGGMIKPNDQAELTKVER